MEITVNLLKDAMDAEYKKSGKNNFLIDGFPRSPENVAGWEKVVGEDANVLFMLFFECPLPVLEERILKRDKWTKRSVWSFSASGFTRSSKRQCRLSTFTASRENVSMWTRVNRATTSRRAAG